MDPSVWGHVAQPHVLGALAQAHFSAIDVSAASFVAAWHPPMSEYQNVAASPTAFGRAVWSTLAALSAMADVLVGH